MRVDEVRKVAVVGAGSMGHGIAELFAMHGYEVNLVDVDEKVLREALRKIEKSLRMMEGELKEGVEKIVQRIHPMVDLKEALREADFALETATEKVDLKEELFRKMDEALPKEAILSTNTSSISVSRLARATSIPERVVGTHFVHAPQQVDGFMPPQLSILLPLVEVVKTEYVGEGALELAKELMRRIGKVPEEVKDSPAFVANRLLVRIGLEAGHAVEEADVYEVDAACLYGLEMPIGVFQLMDVIGLDVGLYILEYLGGVLGEGYHPPEALRMMVEQNYLGQKTGKGFYDYSRGPPEIRREDWRDFDPLNLLAPMVNEACLMVEEGVAEAEKIERVASLSFMPSGFFTLADRFGVERVVEKLGELKGRRGRWYEPSTLLWKLERFSDLPRT